MAFHSLASPACLKATVCFGEKNKNLRGRLYDNIKSSNELTKQYDDLLAAVETEEATYFVGYRNNAAAVLRRSFINGREYHTFIKSFDDEDLDFNLREADELCQALNS